VASPWVLVPQQQQMFDKVYLTVQEGGYVSGQKAKELFVSYGLPIPDLKVIWELSDADKDEQLSHTEFLVSMYLIYRVKQGDSVPDTLPGKLFLHFFVISYFFVSFFKIFVFLVFSCATSQCL
jgi:hypothetical protein